MLSSSDNRAAYGAGTAKGSQSPLADKKGRSRRNDLLRFFFLLLVVLALLGVLCFQGWVIVSCNVLSQDLCPFGDESIAVIRRLPFQPRPAALQGEERRISAPLSHANASHSEGTKIAVIRQRPFRPRPAALHGEEGRISTPLSHTNASLSKSTTEREESRVRQVDQLISKGEIANLSSSIENSDLLTTTDNPISIVNENSRKDSTNFANKTASNSARLDALLTLLNLFGTNAREPATFYREEAKLTLKALDKRDYGTTFGRYAKWGGNGGVRWPGTLLNLILDLGLIGAIVIMLFLIKGNHPLAIRLVHALLSVILCLLFTLATLDMGNVGSKGYPDFPPIWRWCIAAVVVCWVGTGILIAFLLCGSPRKGHARMNIELSPILSESEVASTRGDQFDTVRPTAPVQTPTSNSEYLY